MKFLFTLLLICSLTQLKGQDFEIKIVSTKYQTVRGQLKKVSAEGVALVDYFGHYLIFRPSEIVRIKVRKRGLAVGEATAGGALGGLSAGLLLMSLENEDSGNGGDLLKLTAALSVGGAGVGAIVGVMAELINTKLRLAINEDPLKYQQEYQKLEKYIIAGTVEHVN